MQDAEEAHIVLTDDWGGGTGDRGSRAGQRKVGLSGRAGPLRMTQRPPRGGREELAAVRQVAVAQRDEALLCARATATTCR